MKRFFCDCGQEVYFANTRCEHCGADIGFDSDTQRLYCGVREQGEFVVKSAAGQKRFKLCANHTQPVECNWLLPHDDAHEQCLSCRTTQLIPDLSRNKNPLRWRRLEQAKRYLFYTLMKLNLDVCGREVYPQDGLVFQFLEDQRTNPNVNIEHVLTGHNQGLITLNAAEADEGFLHTMKEMMNEPYRTLLGHFRHEVGHYYWLRLLDGETLDEFRQVFGDERYDYQQALTNYYQYGAARSWQVSFISAYASCHPFEDWAETWAHYLHITDTLETAHAYGLIDYEPTEHDFDVWIAQWAKVTQIMNALNRSMGLADAYPFVLTPIILSKLRFIDRIILAGD